METQLLAYTMMEKLRRKDTSLAHQWRIDALMLKDATPFAWGTETIRAVLAASRSIPGDTNINAWNLDTNAVWWRFDEPLPFKTISESDIGVRAICMAWVYQRAESVMFPAGSLQSEVDRALREGPPIQRILCMSLWIDDPEQQLTIIPSQTMLWHDDESFDQMIERTRIAHKRLYGPGGVREHESQVGEAVFMAATVGMARFTLAALAWLGQKVLVNGEGHIERHRRKDFNKRTGQELTNVRVISLRKAERAAAVGGETHSVEWSCRWTVDGHWRNQPVGVGHAERRLTWIHPFVKGPDDKELRVPKRKVYMVNR